MEPYTPDTRHWTDLPHEVIDRYCVGAITAEDLAQVEALARDARAELEELAHALRAPGVSPTSVVERQRMAHAVLAHTPSLPSRLHGKGVPVGWPFSKWGIVAGIAAAILLVIQIPGWVRDRNTHPIASSEWRELRTATGQRATLQLPDGSAVTLAPESRLRYRYDFGQSERDVYLDGQALFTVVAQTEYPFKVHAPQGVAQVLGTSFVVRKYATDSALRVIVAQGRVSLNQTVLGSGEMGIAHTNTPVRVTRNLSIASALAWTEGRLEFHEVRADAIVSELERWYGVRIVLQNPALRDRPVSFALSVESFDEAMRIFAALLGARYETDGQTVVLR